LAALTRYIAYATGALIAFLALGAYVAAHPEPALFATVASLMLGKSQLVAWWFTWLGYPQVLGPLLVISLAAGFSRSAWLIRAAAPAVATVLAWRLADFFQRFYHRPRPAVWFVKHEHAFSYPSSHAAIAFAFYAFWAVLVYRSELAPRTRAAGAASMTILALGICWSRVALGAHNLTDVAGGALLSAGLVFALLALLDALGISLWPRGVLARKVRTD